AERDSGRLREYGDGLTGGGDLSAALREDFAGQIAQPVLSNHDVVLDAHAPEGGERVDQLPVDVACTRPLTERAQQRVDEVDARLDGEALPLGDDRRIAQERVLRTRLAGSATDVVDLQPERVPPPRRVDGSR